MKTIAILALTMAAACCAASIYWSPYQSCVRSLVEDGSAHVDATTYCARHLKVQ